MYNPASSPYNIAAANTVPAGFPYYIFAGNVVLSAPSYNISAFPYNIALFRSVIIKKTG